MSLIMRCQAAPPKPGTYPATLVSVQEVSGQFDRPAYRWLYATEDGAEISKLTGVEMVQGNTLHRHAEAMRGAPIAGGDQIDLHDLVGREYTIEVAPANGGASVAVASIRPV